MGKNLKLIQVDKDGYTVLSEGNETTLNSLVNTLTELYESTSPLRLVEQEDGVFEFATQEDGWVLTLAIVSGIAENVKVVK